PARRGLPSFPTRRSSDLGAIVGPALVATLLGAGLSWTWLYVAAAGICVLLMLAALRVDYPHVQRASDEPASLQQTLKLLKDPCRSEEHTSELQSRENLVC